MLRNMEPGIANDCKLIDSGVKEKHEEINQKINIGPGLLKVQQIENMARIADLEVGEVYKKGKTL